MGKKKKPTQMSKRQSTTKEERLLAYLSILEKVKNEIAPPNAAMYEIRETAQDIHGKSYILTPTDRRTEEQAEMEHLELMMTRIRKLFPGIKYPEEVEVLKNLRELAQA